MSGRLWTHRALALGCLGIAGAAFGGDGSGGTGGDGGDVHKVNGVYVQTGAHDGGGGVPGEPGAAGAANGGAGGTGGTAGAAGAKGARGTPPAFDWKGDDEIAIADAHVSLSSDSEAERPVSAFTSAPSLNSTTYVLPTLAVAPNSTFTLPSIAPATLALAADALFLAPSSPPIWPEKERVISNFCPFFAAHLRILSSPFAMTANCVF